MTKRKVKGNIRKRAGKGIVSSLLSGAKNSVGAFVNKAIDLLPIEAHLPGGYKYCGPGTRLRERLARGDKPKNGLDEACKAHDIAYAQYSDSARRAKADQALVDKAWQRVKAGDSSIGEKAAAWAVTNIMKVKTKFGGGSKRKRSCRCTGKRKKGKGLYLKPYSKQGGGRAKRKRAGGKKKTLK